MSRRGVGKTCCSVAAVVSAAGAYNATRDAIFKTNNNVPRRFSNFSEKKIKKSS